MEKQGLPLLEEQQRPRLTQKTWIVKRTFSVLVLGILTIFLAKPLIHDLRDRFEPHHKGPNHHGKHHHKDFTSLCQQPQPLYPPQHERLDQAYDFLSTSEFKNASIKRHSGAVQIPTQSFDDLGPVGEDKRWEALYPFTDYLAATFPRIHKELKLEKVNTHGKVYTWEGSDSSLKPLILMAHQDVVPVPDSTVDAWTHPPFSGFFDGKFIWGRGSSDCKNQLIAELETIETLLEYGFEPKRTIILAFGFDEEISGRQGAGRIAAFLIERYGKDSIAAIRFPQSSLEAEDDRINRRAKAFEKNSFRNPKFWLRWQGKVRSAGAFDDAEEALDSDVGYLIFSSNDCERFEGTMSCSRLGWDNVKLQGWKIHSRATPCPLSWAVPDSS